MRCVTNILLAAILSALPGLAMAEFASIKTRSEFVEKVVGKELTIFGIKVRVAEDGVITGRAFGRPVDGAWKWSDGYFCRDLYWGKRDLGPNCQAVMVKNNVVRFQSDRGTGQYADLKIRR